MKAPLPQAAGGKVSADVSWGAVSLLVLLVFVVSLASIAFTRNQTLIATFWPSNAIVLAVALRSSPTLMTYARILAGAAIGIFLANLAGGNSPVLSWRLRPQISRRSRRGSAFASSCKRT
jgi:hypothetical protein